ncbi:MAG TPA: MazG family protein [Actinotalea sp.]|nr:MazG family protein [Actinotalea sp.]
MPRLVELVRVMDRLRSPGGCPWDAEQTAESLVQYAIEEVYEVAEAVESGDREHLREELGDLLLQVVFQARVAQEHPTAAFDLEDVAEGIATKLRRRHPHVFAADAGADLDAAEVHRRWEQIKADEKAERSSALDGVPLAMPALQRAQKLMARAARAGLPTPEPAAVADAEQLGLGLLALVAGAREAGLDAEAALRAAVREFEAGARDAERG